MKIENSRKFLLIRFYTSFNATGTALLNKKNSERIELQETEKFGFWSDGVSRTSMYLFIITKHFDTQVRRSTFVDFLVIRYGRRVVMGHSSLYTEEGGHMVERAGTSSGSCRYNNHGRRVTPFLAALFP